MKRRTFGALIIGATLPISGISAAETQDGSEVFDPTEALRLLDAELTSQGTSIEEQLQLFDLEYSVDPESTESASEAYREAIQAIDSPTARSPLAGPPTGGYTAAMLAVIAWFNLKGYKLAAELLNHSRKPHSRTSIYRPKQGYRAADSSLTRTIARGSATRGSSRYPNSGSVVERDLYYAINKFDWTRSGGTVYITDKYDYALDRNWWKSIAGVAITVMVTAQQMGVLHPFVTKISVYIKR